MAISTNCFVKKVAIVAISASFALALACPCLAQDGGPKFPDPGHPSITRDQQIKLGFQTAAEVYKQMPVLPDSSPETQYVRQLGERLVSTIPRENSWPFEFHVVAQKEINAFALPGGEMFVNLGAITAAKNEAELAGVMGHEMSHVYMQHSAKQMQKSQMTEGLAGLAGAILGARGGVVGALGQTGVQMGAGMLMMKYSRGDEAQADAVGAIILYKAGYNPEALADFFETLKAQGGTGPQFLSDHPNPGNRHDAIQKEIQSWPPEQYRTDSTAFAKVRQQAEGVRAYSGEEIAQGAKAGQWDSLNKKNGAVLKAPAGMNLANPTQASADGGTASGTGGTVSLNDVMPSSKFLQADLGPLKISRPENWDVIAPQQKGQSLTIAPRAGVVSSGVGYGVVINGVSPKDQQMSIDQVTDEIIKALQSGSPDMQTVGKTSDVKVAGVRGRTVNMQSTSPFPNAKGQAQKERDKLVTIPRQDGSVIFMVFVAPESDYERLSPTFEKILQSVQ
jgi:hypothetical protein